MTERDEMAQRQHRAVRVIGADVVVLAVHVREPERPLHQHHGYVDLVQPRVEPVRVAVAERGADQQAGHADAEDLVDPVALHRRVVPGDAEDQACAVPVGHRLGAADHVGVVRRRARDDDADRELTPAGALVGRAGADRAAVHAAEQAGGVQFGQIPAYCDRGDAQLGHQIGHPEPAVPPQAPQDQLVALLCKHAVP